MLFYGRDFYHDENVQVMTLEQEGAYIRLLWNCWQEGSIPNGTANLAALCKNMPVERFERDIWPALGRLFRAAGERLVHDRVEKIREEKGKFSEHARLAAEARWRRDGQSGTENAGVEHQSGINRALPEQCLPSAECRVPSAERKADLDCPPANRKERGSQADAVGERLVPSEKAYPNLSEALRLYMGKRPSDRTVVDILDAAGGATEAEVVACLTYLRNERGLCPGTKNGPQTWNWFQTVVSDYFNSKRARDEVANPCGYHDWAERNESREERERFKEMTGAIELPDA